MKQLGQRTSTDRWRPTCPPDLSLPFFPPFFYSFSLPTIPNKNTTIADRFQRGRVALDNVCNNSDIASHLAAFSYDEKRIAAGQALYDKAFALHAKRQDEYGEQIEATVNVLYNTLKNTYMTHIKLSCLAFKDDTKTAISIDLYGRCKQNLSAAIAQIKVFYTNMLNHNKYQEPLQNFGVTYADLEAARQQLQEVETAPSQSDSHPVKMTPCLVRSIFHQRRWIPPLHFHLSTSSFSYFSFFSSFIFFYETLQPPHSGCPRIDEIF